MYYMMSARAHDVGAVRILFIRESTNNRTDKKMKGGARYMPAKKRTTAKRKLAAKRKTTAKRKPAARKTTAKRKPAKRKATSRKKR